MSNTSPRIVHLKSLLALEEKRTALQEQIDDIEQQILSIRDQILGNAPSTVARTVRKIVPKGGRAQRGALKAQIIAALESAGHAGVRVTELAEAIGTKAANLHAWFHATAKRMPSIVKVAGGHYRLNGSSNGAKVVAPAATTKAPKVKASKGKGGKAKRGALSENVMAALESAGSNGISIKDLSDKVGSNYRNVAVWFATTGKKNPKIKKVAPATYKLAA